MAVDENFFFPGSAAIGLNIQGCDGCTFHHLQGSGGVPLVNINPPGTSSNFYVAGVHFVNPIIDEASCASCYPFNIAATTGSGGVGDITITDPDLRGDSTTQFEILITKVSGVTPHNIDIVGGVLGNGAGSNANVAVYNNGGDQVSVRDADIVCTPTNSTSACVFGNVATSYDITHNRITAGTNGYAIAFEGATGAVNMQGNTLIGPLFEADGTTQKPVNLDDGFGVFPTSLVMETNKGQWDLNASIADAATLTLPFTKNWTLTGTGTAVTAISAGTCWKGRTGTFIATNGSPPQFTAGSTIGNTLTPVQNVPVLFYCDGTKIWLK